MNADKTIYKYTLDQSGLTRLDLPIGAQILCVKNQNEDLVIWVLSSCGHSRYKRRNLKAISTGEVFQPDDGYKYIDTVLFDGGDFVLHVFELICPA